MRQNLGILRLLGLGLLLAAVGGCGDDKVSGLAPVTGTVTYNGQPVEGATVSFIPRGGVMGAAQTDKDGKFTITTRGQAGAQIGAHNVSVSKKSAATGAAAPAFDPSKPPPSPEEAEKILAAARDPANAKPTGPQDLLPAKYANASTSGLEFTVKSGANDFPINLTDQP